MARIEWVKQRLDNWARWKEREQRHGLGFYTQSAFLRMAVDVAMCMVRFGFRSLVMWGSEDLQKGGA